MKISRHPWRRLLLGSVIVCSATAWADVGQVTVLHSFDGTDGFNPAGPLTQAKDGNFYGTTVHPTGTVFQMTPAGTVTSLHSFGVADGLPLAPLVEGADGKIYGASFGFGTNGIGDSYGSLFTVTYSGDFNSLYLFDASNAYPSGLVLGSDGNFYGTTDAGGNYGRGSLFQLTPAGVLTVVHSFSPTDGIGGIENPLIQGSDGDFYGTGGGVAFKVTSAGEVTILHSFDFNIGDASSLLLASDGNFYGTTPNGGKYGGGMLFKMTSRGQLSTLHDFKGGADGDGPLGALVQGQDGFLYGITAGGIIRTW